MQLLYSSSSNSFNTTVELVLELDAAPACVHPLCLFEAQQIVSCSVYTLRASARRKHQLDIASALALLADGPEGVTLRAFRVNKNNICFAPTAATRPETAVAHFDVKKAFTNRLRRLRMFDISLLFPREMIYSMK